MVDGSAAEDEEDAVVEVEELGAAGELVDDDIDLEDELEMLLEREIMDKDALDALLRESPPV